MFLLSTALSAEGLLSPWRPLGVLTSWERSLKARNCAPRAIHAYARTASNFLEYLERSGMPTDVSAMTREHIESYIVSLAESGKAAATVAQAYRNLQQLFRWLEEDGEIAITPMARMKPPRVPEVLVGRAWMTALRLSSDRS